VSLGLCRKSAFESLAVAKSDLKYPKYLHFGNFFLVRELSLFFFIYTGNGRNLFASIMDTYTKEDLEVRPWNQAQAINWNGISLPDARRIIRSWLQIPVLRPQNPSVTWDDYEDLGLARIKTRVTELDWVGKNTLKR
jgi:hypothetical protein